MSVRIVVKGASGAGKTTLAAKLARHFAVPHVELDALHHGPNWTAASAGELRSRVLAALDDRQGWIVDGNYESKLDSLVLDRAELIVWLDLPLVTKLARLVHRTALRVARREELWNGNRENLVQVLWGPESLLVWAVRSHIRHRQQWPRSLATRHVIRLRSARETEAWFAELTRSRSRPW